MKKCIDCATLKPLEDFSKHVREGSVRPECKVCEKRRRVQKKESDPFLYAVNSLADGVLKRTKYATHKPKNYVYRKYGIRNLLGNDRSEIRKVLIDNFEQDICKIIESGCVPSLDRVDHTGHYEISNIRVVPLIENIKNADQTTKSVPVTIEMKNGDSIKFPSITDASKYLDCKRDTIYDSLKKDRKTRKGWKAVLAIKEADR